jgi:hypothetical protein
MLQYLNSRGHFLLSLSNVSTANEESNHVLALPFVIPSPPICWQRLAKEYFKKTKRRAKPVLLSQLLAMYGQEAKPVQARQASKW